MLDYDKEAAVYDATRGGIPRARSAAEAVLGLVPPTARTLLDLACGTGLVTMRLTRPGLRAVGIDLAPGMLRAAAPRLDGAAVRGDSRQLPFRSASVDVVTVIWLLHLLPDARPVIAEAARVLRPGGVLVTTVDKAAAHDVGSDIDTLVAPYRGRFPPTRPHRSPPTPPTTDCGRAERHASPDTARAAPRGASPTTCGAAEFTRPGAPRSPTDSPRCPTPKSGERTRSSPCTPSRGTSDARSVRGVHR